jgi:tetratricopeptide (TPR) repeat protein
MKWSKFYCVLPCAAALLLVAAQAHGQAADGPRQQALALEHQGDASGAATSWREVLQRDPSDSSAYAHLAQMEARQQNFAQAADDYRQALALGSSLPGLRLNLGLALFQANQMKDAFAVFAPLLKSAPPTSAEAQRLTILMGMAQYGLGDYAAAVPYLQLAARRDAQNLPLRLTLAHSCLWSRQNQCVLDVYKEILALNPNSAEAYMLAGEALDAMKQTSAAIEQFRAAVKINPQEPHAHFGLGYLLWTQKQYDEAAQEFQAELGVDPADTQAMLYLADTQIKAHRFAQAQPLLERVEKADPSLALAHLDMAIVLSEADQTAEALRELKEANRLNPEVVDVHWRLGRIYRSQGKLEEAKAEFAKANALNKAADQALFRMIAKGRPPSDPPPADAPAAR